MPSHEEWSALVALAAGERAALLDASTLAGGVLEEPRAAAAWGVDADVLAKCITAPHPLERTTILEVLDRYAAPLGSHHHNAALGAAGVRPA